MEETRTGKALVERFLKELDGDRDAIDVFLSADCRAYLPGGVAQTDRRGFKEFVGTLYEAFPDLHHRIEEQVAEGDRVATVVTARGTHRGEFQGISPTGKQITITDIIVTRVQAGKIIVLWAQFDALGLLRQLNSPRK